MYNCACTCECVYPVFTFHSLRQKHTHTYTHTHTHTHSLSLSFSLLALYTFFFSSVVSRSPFLHLPRHRQLKISEKTKHWKRANKKKKKLKDKINF